MRTNNFSKRAMLVPFPFISDRPFPRPQSPQKYWAFPNFTNKTCVQWVRQAHASPCTQLGTSSQTLTDPTSSRECNVFLTFNQFESFPTFTETNLAVISTTIRYGSFQLRARAVPKNFGFPNKVSSTTVNNIAVDTIPTVVPIGPVMKPTTTKGQTGSTKPTPGLLPTTKLNSGSNTSTMPSVEIITPMAVNSSAGLQPESFH